MAALMQVIDGAGVDSALVGHFECEPIFLYPELDERGWSHEILESHCGGGADCEDGLMLRMVALGSLSRLFSARPIKYIGRHLRGSLRQ